MKALYGTLSAEKAEYAVTGRGAAWLYTRFAGFRIVTLYLAGPSTEVLEQVGFSETRVGRMSGWRRDF